MLLSIGIFHPKAATGVLAEGGAVALAAVVLILVLYRLQVFGQLQGAAMDLAPPILLETTTGWWIQPI